MHTEKRYLFVSRPKLDQLISVYHQGGIRVGSKEIVEHYPLIKTVQYGWYRSVPNRRLLATHSYLIDWLSGFLPYRVWLTLSRVLSHVPPARWAEQALFNAHLAVLGYGRRFDVLVFYDRRIWNFTQRLLAKWGIHILEYDGTPPTLSLRDFSKEVSIERKYLFSNMDLRDILGANVDRFRQIHLGLTELIGADPPNQVDRGIDVMHVGRLSFKGHHRRCECVERVLERYSETLNIKLFGSKLPHPDFPHISKLPVEQVYGAALFEVLSRSKVTVVVPSDDLHSSRSGMPMRLFENAACGVVQLVSRDCDIGQTEFEEDVHYLGFTTQEELLEKLSLALADSGLRQKIATAAWELYREKYTAEVQFRRLLDSIFGGSGERIEPAFQHVADGHRNFPTMGGS